MIPIDTRYNTYIFGNSSAKELRFGQLYIHVSTINGLVE